MSDIPDAAIIRKYIEFRDTLDEEGKIATDGAPGIQGILDGIEFCCANAAYNDLVAIVREQIIPILRRRMAGTKPITEAMEMLAGFMHSRLNERGDDSVKTEFGTAYRQRTMSVRTADKDALFNFIRESDDFQLLAGNVSKDAIKTHMEEHGGLAPPGIDVTYITKTLFRRA